jgi:NADH-quinone oxidoreductase subunit I
MAPTEGIARGRDLPVVGQHPPSAGMPRMARLRARDVKDVSRPDLGHGRSWWVRTYIPAILNGMAVTMRHLVRNLRHRRNTATIEYPEVKREYGYRHRGRHYLKKRPNGDPRCVACFMCATACPADCIFIVAGEHPDPAVEKYPVEFVIDGLRCIYCGYCVDACPEDAIAMTRDYELAGYHREDFIWDKEYLLNWREHVERQDGYQPYEGEIDKERMSRGRL